MNAVPTKTVIEDVALELGLDPAFVEKDWYVVQLIREISNAKLLGTDLIFTGGTALSKAHRLIQRFSEDIDFRLLLPQKPLLSKSARRKLLSGVRSRLRNIIINCIPTTTIEWKSRDENRFFSFELAYPSVVRQSAALRPHVLIEFTTTTLSLPPIMRSVSSFIAELTNTAPEASAVACIDPIENAVDKISALIWRVPDRVREPEDNDPDLVRHIHDLAILQPHIAKHAGFRHLAIETIRQDDHRCRKIAGLPIEKKKEILLDILISDKEYRTEYNRFVHGMSYASIAIPTYDEAIAKLRTLIEQLL